MWILDSYNFLKIVLRHIHYLLLKLPQYPNISAVSPHLYDILICEVLSCTPGYFSRFCNDVAKSTVTVTFVWKHSLPNVFVLQLTRSLLRCLWSKPTFVLAPEILIWCYAELVRSLFGKEFISYCKMKICYTINCINWF